MKTILELLKELKGRDVTEFAMVSNRFPCVKVHGAFKRLALRGTRAFFVFGADDAGLDEVEREMRMPARQIGRMPGVNLAIVHGADHAFTVPPARADLIQQVQQFLHDHGAVR